MISLDADGIIAITELDASRTPTSKRVGLTLPQWNRLIDYSKDILADFERQKQDKEVNSVYELGDEVRVRIAHPYWLADLRQWYTSKPTADQEAELLPTRRGVKVHHEQFSLLIAANTRIQVACEYFRAAEGIAAPQTAPSPSDPRCTTNCADALKKT
jgi:hypothetical protein